MQVRAFARISLLWKILSAHSYCCGSATTHLLNHLARSIPWDPFQASAIAHDTMTQHTFRSIIGQPDLSSRQWQQCCLPVKRGGFGLLSLKHISEAAFIAGWASSAEELPKRFFSLITCFNFYFICHLIMPQIPELGNISSIPFSPSILCRCHQMYWPTWKPGANIKSFIQASTLPDVCCTYCMAHPVDKLFSQSAREAAWLCSTQGESVGEWVEAIPTLDKFALAAYLRLGVPAFLQHYLILWLQFSSRCWGFSPSHLQAWRRSTLGTQFYGLMLVKLPNKATRQASPTTSRAQRLLFQQWPTGRTLPFTILTIVRHLNWMFL